MPSTDFLLEWSILTDSIQNIKGSKKSQETWSTGGRTDSKIQVTNFNSELMKRNLATLIAPPHTDHSMVLAEKHRLLHKLIL